MVGLLKELVDELVTQCLANALEDAACARNVGGVLDKILALDLVSKRADLAEQIRRLRADLSGLERAKKPNSDQTQALLQALEDLSHALYTLAAELATTGTGSDEVERALTLPPEVDAQVFHEFLSNAQLSLDDLDREIEAIRQGIPDTVAAIKRRVHTLKGESGMLGLGELEHLLHCTESFLECPVTPWERADRLLMVRDWVGEAIEAYAEMHHPVVAPAQIEATLLLHAESSPMTADLPHDQVEPVAQDGKVANPPGPAADIPEQAVDAPVRRVPRQTSPNDALDSPIITTSSADLNLGLSMPTASPESVVTEPAPPDDHPGCPWPPEDDELVQEFLHELEEHLTTVDQVLLDTEQEDLNAERINKLFRAFHTVKGVASFLQLHQCKEVTHTTETMLDRIRSGRPIPCRQAVDLVFDATALLRELAADIRKSLTNHCALRVHDGVGPLLARLNRAIDERLSEPQGPLSVAAPGERLGEILIRKGVVDAATVAKVLESQKATGHKLGEALIAQGAVPAKAVAHALRAQRMNAEGQSKLKDVVKVDLERVDQLVEAIGELVIVESMVSNAPEIRQLPGHLRNYLSQLAKITRELQKLGMSMRMVPVRSEFQKMARITRDLARRSNKQVRMELSGEGTEMDRIMVEQIAAPLVHLIRNAVDHGIAAPEARRAAGKPEVGTIRLAAGHEGGSIIIEVTDDGRGIDRERVLAKAIERGIVDTGSTLTESQVLDLIFAPGFSTAAQVTEISGRGVGMDVVKRNIEAVRGRITISSVPGRGTTFRLVLPLTLAIIDGMVVRCASERFILPTLNIVESLQPSPDMLFSVMGSQEHLLVRGQSLPLLRLNRLLDIEGGETDPTKALVVIVESLNAQVALLVDEVVMKQQVVIKTLTQELDTARIFAGAAILSNGRVGLIVNIESLIDSARISAGLTLETRVADPCQLQLN